MTQITVRALAQAIAKRLGENGADFISETDADSTIEEMIAAWLAPKEGVMKQERIAELKARLERRRKDIGGILDRHIAVPLDDFAELIAAVEGLASEPTQTDRDTAGLILLRAFREPGALGVPMFQLGDMIAAALASARTAAEARVRAEAIEECAKVADTAGDSAAQDAYWAVAENDLDKEGRRLSDMNTAREIASAIRAFGGAA